MIIRKKDEEKLQDIEILKSLEIINLRRKRRITVDHAGGLIELAGPTVISGNPVKLTFKAAASAGNFLFIFPVEIFDFLGFRISHITHVSVNLEYFSYIYTEFRIFCILYIRFLFRLFIFFCVVLIFYPFLIPLLLPNISFSLLRD